MVLLPIVNEEEELEQGIDRQTIAFREMLKDSGMFNGVQNTTDSYHVHSPTMHDTLFCTITLLTPFVVLYYHSL